MRAMILAAGRGERMGMLTEHTPKPLLRIANHYLIEYTLLNLKKAGITDIVINVSYHAQQIMDALGNGQQYGLTIAYSIEEERLETGGGIVKALPLLGEQPFIVTSADIITDFPFETLKLHAHYLAHIVMVNNPSYHLKGDFALIDGELHQYAEPKYTYANISIYHPKIFAEHKPSYFRLMQIVRPLIDKGLVSGAHYQGLWHNIGTVTDLQIATETLQIASL